MSTATPDTDAHRAPPGSPLVTGGHGFAGRHLVGLLSNDGGQAAAPSSGELNLCDGGALRAVVRDLGPRAVFHLAAFSSPTLSWERPHDAVVTNIEMTLNVLEAVRHEAPEATVVLVGSGQIYGAPAELPISEDAPRDPGNPYAVSKVSCEMLGRQYATGFGMRVVQVHPFNHAGPGQSDEYVVSSLARQVAEAELQGLSEAVLRTGDPHSARDFTDVRDVVRAYALAAELDGGVFNVCSGKSATVAELIEMVSRHARIPVRHEVDPSRLRANDARDLRGSHERLTEATGWKPEIPLDQTVADTLSFWRSELAR